jgi:hypothetical protein
MRTISKGRCRYDWFSFTNHQCACADFVDFATQRNGGRGREKGEPFRKGDVVTIGSHLPTTQCACADFVKKIYR